MYHVLESMIYIQISPIIFVQNLVTFFLNGVILSLLKLRPNF